MGAQEALVGSLASIAGGVLGVEKGLAAKEKEAEKKAEAKDTAPAAQEQPKQQEITPSPKQPKSKESPKVQALEKALQRSQDSLRAALLQKQRRESADHLNLVNQLRRMKAQEIAKREETK